MQCLQYLQIIRQFCDFTKFQSQYIIYIKMQGEKPRRGQRRREETRYLNINISNWSEFISAKLDPVFPGGYAEMNDQKKQEIWTDLLEKLKNQTQKVFYLLADNKKPSQVNFIIQVINKNNSQNIFDYEYEDLFLGKKKQLLIFLKCHQMDSYLQKYKLPQSYKVAIQGVQKYSKQIFQAKIQRNIAISLFDKQKASEVSKQIKSLEQKSNSQLRNFEQVMKTIFEHFKQQKKRTIINLQAIRQNVYENLIPLAEKLQLFIDPKFPNIDNDEFVEVQVTKKNQSDKYFEPRNLQDQQEIKDNLDDHDEQDHDQSSAVSDLSEQTKQIELQKQLRKALPPVGIYNVKFQKYQNELMTLRVSLQMVRNKNQHPSFLQYTQEQGNFKQFIPIMNTFEDVLLRIPIKKGGHLSYYLRTRNDAGYSNIKNFNYYLNLDKDLNMIKNRNLVFIGESKVLIPIQRSKKQDQLNYITLATSDFSISTTQVLICDCDGNSADWGLMRGQGQKDKQIIQSNQYYNIINNKDNMYYQEPAVRLQKSYKIIKTSCGRGYGMLLDAYGTVWVFGKNTFGQLGTKEEIGSEETVQIKFFKENKIFITDIKASECSASFAIDSKGTLYKWGANQFLSTQYPLTDRFGSVINYSTANCIQEQWNPLVTKKHFSGQKIMQVECGHEFYLMLNNQGTLYGWGQCRNLGKGMLKDGKDEQIQNICNDIEIMRNVKKFSAGKDHAIVLTKQGKVLVWGNLKYLSNYKIQFIENPLDLTQEYGQVTQEDIIVCGPRYTCLYKAKEGNITLFGDSSNFGRKQFQINKKITKIECEQHVIGLLVQK